MSRRIFCQALNDSRDDIALSTFWGSGVASYICPSALELGSAWRNDFSQNQLEQELFLPPSTYATSYWQSIDFDLGGSGFAGHDDQGSFAYTQLVPRTTIKDNKVILPEDCAARNWPKNWLYSRLQEGLAHLYCRSLVLLEHQQIDSPSCISILMSLE